MTELGRSHIHPATNFVPWSLGQSLPIGSLTEKTVLIHCAWDMKTYDQKCLQTTNVTGSLHLFEQAKKLGVRDFIFLSTLSAFDGTASFYGQTKLQVEKWVLQNDGVVIRPGLIWGGDSGLVQTLKKVLTKIPLVFVPGAACQLYLCHKDDLASLICRIVALKTAGPSLDRKILAAANPRSWKFIDLLKELARQNHKRPVLVPIPWQVPYLFLRLAELLHLRLPFKSDSLLGMLFTNPNAEFGENSSHFQTFALSQE